MAATLSNALWHLTSHSLSLAFIGVVRCRHGFSVPLQTAGNWFHTVEAGSLLSKMLCQSGDEAPQVSLLQPMQPVHIARIDELSDFATITSLEISGSSPRTAVLPCLPVKVSYLGREERWHYGRQLRLSAGLLHVSNTGPSLNAKLKVLHDSIRSSLRSGHLSLKPSHHVCDSR